VVDNLTHSIDGNGFQIHNGGSSAALLIKCNSAIHVVRLVRSKVAILHLKLQKLFFFRRSVARDKGNSGRYSSQSNSVNCFNFMLHLLNYSINRPRKEKLKKLSFSHGPKDQFFIPGFLIHQFPGCDTSGAHPGCESSICLLHPTYDNCTRDILTLDHRATTTTMLSMDRNNGIVVIIV
jgi:hypothetical protein